MFILGTAVATVFVGSLVDNFSSSTRIFESLPIPKSIRDDMSLSSSRGNGEQAQVHEAQINCVLCIINVR